MGFVMKLTKTFIRDIRQDRASIFQSVIGKSTPTPKIQKRLDN